MTHPSQEERIKLNRNKIAKLRLKRARFMTHILETAKELIAVRAAGERGWLQERVVWRIELAQERVRELNGQIDKLERIRYRLFHQDATKAIPQPKPQHEAVAA
jgi:hypothetical protein